MPADARTQVVELDAGYRERIRKYQMHYYMYGKVLEPPPSLAGVACLQGGEQTPELTLNLSPSSSIVSFNDLTIYRIGEGAFSRFSSALIPINSSVSRNDGPHIRTPHRRNTRRIRNATPPRRPLPARLRSL